MLTKATNYPACMKIGFSWTETGYVASRSPPHTGGRRPCRDASVRTRHRILPSPFSVRSVTGSKPLEPDTPLSGSGGRLREALALHLTIEHLLWNERNTLMFGPLRELAPRRFSCLSSSPDALTVPDIATIQSSISEVTGQT